MRGAARYEMEYLVLRGAGTEKTQSWRKSWVAASRL